MQAINSAKPSSQAEHLSSSVSAMGLHMQCKDNSTCVIHCRQLAGALTGWGDYFICLFFTSMLQHSAFPSQITSSLSFAKTCNLLQWEVPVSPQIFLRVVLSCNARCKQNCVLHHRGAVFFISSRPILHPGRYLL